MRAIGTAVGQALVLIAIASVLGLGANAVRGKDHVRLERDYKPRIQTQPAPLTLPATSTTTAPAPAGAGDDEPQILPPTDTIPFQMVNLAEARRVYEEEAATGYGLNLFLDARADAAYEAGHIPGAVQCNPWRPEAYMDAPASRALGAERVIVYCNGNECEDSLLACDELQKRGVPWGNIYLFKGGWEAWSGARLPSESGRRAQP